MPVPQAAQPERVHLVYVPIDWGMGRRITCPTQNPSSPALQRFQHTRRREWNLPYARARRVENGVGDGRTYNRDGCLACAHLLLVRTVDQHRLNLGQKIAELVNREYPPVRRTDGPVRGPRYFLMQRPAHALKRSALHLIAQSVGI